MWKINTVVLERIINCIDTLIEEDDNIAEKLKLCSQVKNHQIFITCKAILSCLQKGRKKQVYNMIFVFASFDHENCLMVACT